MSSWMDSNHWLHVGLMLCIFGVVGGFYWDLNEHMAGAVETFFRASHSLVYASVLLAGWFTYSLRKRGEQHYSALIGIILLLLGGLFDGFWHQIFGFESDIDAFVSPPHTIILAGMFFLAATFVYESRRHTDNYWYKALGIVSSGMTLAVINYSLMFTSPLYFDSPKFYALISFVLHTFLILINYIAAKRLVGPQPGLLSTTILLGHAGIIVTLDGYWFLYALAVTAVLMELITFFDGDDTTANSLKVCVLLPVILWTNFFLFSATFSSWTLLWSTLILLLTALTGLLVWIGHLDPSQRKKFHNFLGENQKNPSIKSLLLFLSPHILLVNALTFSHPFYAPMMTASYSLQTNYFVTTTILFAIINGFRIRLLSSYYQLTFLSHLLIYASEALLILSYTKTVYTLLYLGSGLLLSSAISVLNRYGYDNLLLHIVAAQLIIWPVLLGHMTATNTIDWGVTMLFGTVWAAAWCAAYSYTSMMREPIYG